MNSFKAYDSKNIVNHVMDGWNWIMSSFDILRIVGKNYAKKNF
jgi:hypothetical protein